MRLYISGFKLVWARYKTVTCWIVCKSWMWLLILTFYFVNWSTPSLLYRATYVICDRACYLKLCVSFSWKTQHELRRPHLHHHPPVPRQLQEPLREPARYRRQLRCPAETAPRLPKQWNIATLRSSCASSHDSHAWRTPYAASGPMTIRGPIGYNRLLQPLED
jgi:hypothetical protein